MMIPPMVGVPALPPCMELRSIASAPSDLRMTCPARKACRRRMIHGPIARAIPNDNPNASAARTVM